MYLLLGIIKVAREFLPFWVFLFTCEVATGGGEKYHDY